MFRFTIRDLLWLTVVVAVALSLLIAWQKDRMQLTNQRKNSESQLMEVITVLTAKIKP